RWLQVRMHPHFQLALGVKAPAAPTQTTVRPTLSSPVSPSTPSQRPSGPATTRVIPNQSVDLAGSAPRHAIDARATAPRPVVQPRPVVAMRPEAPQARVQTLEQTMEVEQPLELKPFKPTSSKQKALDFIDLNDELRAEETQAFEPPSRREAKVHAAAEVAVAPMPAAPAPVSVPRPIAPVAKAAPVAPAAPAAPSGKFKAVVIEKPAAKPLIAEADLDFPPPSTVLPGLATAPVAVTPEKLAVIGSPQISSPAPAMAAIDGAAALITADLPSLASAMSGIATESRKRSALPMMAGLAAVLALGVGILVWRPWVLGLSAETGAANEPVAAVSHPTFAGMASAPPASMQSVAPGAVRPGAPASQIPASSQAAGTIPSTPAAPLARPAVLPAHPPVETVAADSARSEPIIPSAVKVDLPTGGVIPGMSADIGRSATTGPTIAPSVLAKHYAAAYADAIDELDGKIDQLGFSKLFQTDHLASESGVSSERHVLSSASSAIRAYRARSTEIEQAYQDTLMQSERRQKSSPDELRAWAAHASQRESQDAVQFTDLMISQVDSLFGLLSAQHGHYSVSGDNITFSDAQAGKQYQALRAWVNQRADAWAGTPESAMPASVKYVLRAIGSPKLPK
ncbi:MAG: hypothetical protein ABJD11_07045, partial [Gemmatimonadota bacterium]